MTTLPTLVLDKRFRNRVQARYDKHEFQIGVLTDRPYQVPRSKKTGLGSLRGGPVRRKSARTRGNVSDVSKAMRKRTNFLAKPFERPRAKDYRLFRRELFNWISKRGGKRHRVLSYFRAIVRNPMLRKAYGSNARSTAKQKGFNRFMFDTGQLFRNITAKILRKK